MKVHQLGTYPATVMLVLAAAYVIMKVPNGERAQSFAMFAFTSIGATELVLAALARSRGDNSGRTIWMHVLTGVGALSMGYALLNELSVVPFVIGALLLTCGIVLWQGKIGSPS